MAQSLGTLFIELIADTANFVGGMDKASYKARQTAKEIETSFDKIGDSFKEALGEFGPFGAKLNAIGSSVSGLFNSFKIGGSGIAATIGALTGIGVAAVGAAAGITALAIEGGEAIERLGLISQKTGIAVRDLQVFEAAGKTVNISLEEMVAAMRKFDQGLEGNGKSANLQKAVLDGLGVTAKTNKEALLQVADAFSKMDDGARKNADAVALFGRAGIGMIPFLNKGREGVQEFEKVVDEFGPVITRGAIEAQEKWKKSTVELSLAWESFQVAFAPVLKFVAEMTEEIAKLLKGMADLAAFAVKSPASAVKSITAAGAFLATGGLGLPPGGTTAFAGIAADNEKEIQRQKDEAAAKDAKDAATNKQIASERKLFEIEKDGGQAAYRLEQQRAQIAAAVANQEFAIALGYQKQLPALEEAARIEKEARLEKRLKPTNLGQKPITEGILSQLLEEAGGQEKLAAATATTAGAYAVLEAIQKADLEVNKNENKLIEEKAQIISKVQTAGNRLPAQERVNSRERLRQIDDELTRLRSAKPEIEQLYAEIAAGKGGEGLTKKLAGQGDALKEQSDALDNLSRAYLKGGAAIQAAQVEEHLSGEKKEVLEAQQALDAYTAKFGASAKGAEEFRERLRLANVTLGEHRDLLLEINDEEIVAGTLREAAGFTIATYALTQQIGVLKDLQAENRNTADSDALLYHLQIQLMEDVQAHTVALANLQLFGDAQIYDSHEKLLKQWDDSVAKVGTFSERFRGLMNELVLDGQNFGEKVFASFHKAIDDLSTELAKFVVTGQANFRQIAQGLEQSVLKATFQKGIGTIGAAVNNKLFGGLIPGLGGTSHPDGSASNPFHVVFGGGGIGAKSEAGIAEGLKGALSSVTSNLNGFFGKIFSGGAFGGILKSLGGLFGGFLAGGGDVTPGKAYVVGEKHPEFFLPRQSGRVVPTIQTQWGGHTEVHLHINGVTDYDSFQRSQNQFFGDALRAMSAAHDRTR